MKVLVVGATGVVGRQLVPLLAAAGHRVTATSRSGAAVPTSGPVEFRPLDVLDAGEVKAVLHDVRPDVIVHQATALSALGNNLRKFDQLFAPTNRLRTDGTANLIGAAASVGSPRLIVQSFCGWTWAPSDGLVKSEEDPLDDHPAKAFRQTLHALRIQETLVLHYPGGVALRYGGLYGPGTSLGPGGPQIVAVQKGWLPLVGSAAGVWSFLHVSDAASAVLAALDHGRGIYNIVDDDPAAVRAWLPELARLAGGPPPRHIPAWLARLVGGDGLVRMMTTARGSSNAKARAELDWAPSYPSWRAGFAAEFAQPTQVSPSRHG